MNILAIETSTKQFSLAVCQDRKILAQKNIKLNKVLSDSIIPAIKKILNQAKVSLTQLDGLAIGLGPGSFTSLRVGVSTMKGLAWALKLPVAGIPSLDALAMSVQGNDLKSICVLMDARRNQVYASFYEKKGGQLKRKSEYFLTAMPNVLKKIQKETILIGDGIKVFKEQIERLNKGLLRPEKEWYPKARYVAQLAEVRFRKKDFDDPMALVPLYLYPQDCQVEIKVRSRK